MRRDKTSLVLGDSTILGSLIARFSSQFGQVIVVQRPGQSLAVGDALTAQDLFANAGPLAGIHAGLLASPDDANIVLACDMPHADPAIAHYLISLLDGCDAVVPQLDRGPEPLFAAYRRSVLPFVENSIRTHSLRLRNLLDSISTLYVSENDLRKIDPQLRCFLNINTPEDYTKLIRST